MRFLVDECTGPGMARWLAGQGHQVYSVYDESPGIKDIEIIEKCKAEDWILITNDKDFGELAFRYGLSHVGVILMRLADERPDSKIEVMTRLLESYSDRLFNSFVVVSEKQVRFSRGQF